MLSYQHSYHAGNHADVLKHIILGDVLAGMFNKEKPLFMLDAFASRGIYALDSEQALKNREFDSGIGKLWELRNYGNPQGVARWFKLIATENPEGGFNRFPGSTALLHNMARELDRLTACDLHPQEFDKLRESFQANRRFSLLKRDAFEALKALLPPKEKRGLIFLDPSYEIKEEYRAIAKAVTQAHRRFATGVYVIWYPLLPAERHLDLFRELKASGIRKILRVELDCGDCFPEMQMSGSGMLIVNPPWHAEQAMKDSLNWVCDHLTDGKGKKYFGWLVPE
ncbi:23S rRNA (adenine(2030)-N(6))-methyltransferase RlmJ [Mariprofundus sp. NF]|uniref:23S rRNA (adenine(2030)-N(6))-methyltransferase RlmJ n=1 Tax=Mariprofundus sp. NF TaxID=2608716 RepID=UPI00159F93F0|nr:23S rRNA (adenine(2030)-N(6))-methyltransferase RlmJ [Mariprofundus sp. NF]NWF37818.1 23S rRNA (adenine(2030)-N(6))-methyltransferase RlmJ [Mariprofundus sp. NF]